MRGRCFDLPGVQWPSGKCQSSSYVPISLTGNHHKFYWAVRQMIFYGPDLFICSVCLNETDEPGCVVGLIRTVSQLRGAVAKHSPAMKVYLIRKPRPSSSSSLLNLIHMNRPVDVTNPGFFTPQKRSMSGENPNGPSRISMWSNRHSNDGSM